MDSTTSRRITVAEMAPHIHSFLPDENKVDKLTKWLSDWIKASLENGKIKPYDILPSKGDLACHIGVSQGTVQSVFRLVEDMGLVKSKQRIGTYISNRKNKNAPEKLTSKREIAIEAIKEYIIRNGYNTGDVLISTRKLSKIINITDTTLRLAITNLVMTNILEKKGSKFYIKTLNYKIENRNAKTLVEKVAESLKAYIEKEFKEGDKLPSNISLTKKFNVSTKTIHDAIKLLSKAGLVHSRRGKYGTVVLGSSTEMYFYEKIEQKISCYISEKTQVGDKLPTIKEFSMMYDTSEKTVKKALDNLADDGYVTFMRGRYGGTFVMDIPQTSKEAYKWLAINSDYMRN